ncbi:site-2 protease family protein [Microbulbifer halophilus]|uniref:Site-2 protease family protein n=3 Tax=Microbulbifer halophilus TaxID=453963 RepID=A0ABW5EH54_9GAMM
MRKLEYLKLFSISGVPVFIHWSLSVPLVLIAVLAVSEISMLIVAISILMVMLIHEIGHMWFASKLGLRSVRISLYLLHGQFSFEKADNDYHNCLVSWGGVAAQAIVFIPCIAIFSLYSASLPWYVNVPLMILGYINALIAVVNMAPAMGLDGEECWKSIPLYFKYYRPRSGRDKKNRKHLKSVK